MKRVLLIGGCKQSGKTSTANFLTGYQMKANNVIDKFEIDDDGNLNVNAEFYDGDGNPYEDMGILDLTQNNEAFFLYAQQKIWPYCRINNIADPLKETVHLLFGVPLNLLYGTNADKEKDSGVSWDKMLFFYKGQAVKQKRDELKKDGREGSNLTVRELLKEFGDICRKLDEDCFVRPTVGDIVQSECELTVVGDGRFVNEFDFFDAEADKGSFELKKIYFTRKIDDDKHISESLHKHYPMDNFDAVIDNSKMSINEKNQKVLSHLLNWGWVDAIMG